MGTITGQNIADKAELVLSDSSNVRWAEAELLGWINTAQRAIASLKPNATAAVANVTMVAGAKQSLPSGYQSLISVTRNMGTGSTPGRAITMVNKVDLDTAFPGWHGSSYAATTVKACAFDERDPRTFWVYPPQPAATTQQIEAEVSAAPSDLDELASAISVDDIYEPVILDYVLYRAFSKDIASAPNRERADAHQRRYMEALGIRSQVESAYAPRRQAQPPQPQPAAAGG